MSTRLSRSGSRKRNPLEDVNSKSGGSKMSQKKKPRRSARKNRRQSSENVDDVDVSRADSSILSAQMAELQDLSELNSSVMSETEGRRVSIGGSEDHTASLGDLAKLMQSPNVEEKTANSRRQTADPEALGRLNEMFNSSDDDDDDDASTTIVDAEKAIKSPAANIEKSMPKPLKSCISARKTRSTQRKGVRFGSPDAAEFHKDMATSNVTPLPKAYTKRRYHMASPETQARAASAEAAENDRILASASKEDVSVSSKITGSARRQSMQHDQSPGASPASSHKAQKALEFTKRGDYSATDSIEDELRTLAPLPSPMDPRRRSTIPNLKILQTVDAKYVESPVSTGNSVAACDQSADDTDYTADFTDVSIAKDSSLWSPPADSGNSTAGETSGTNMTVPLQSLKDLLEQADDKKASDDASSPEDVSEDYTRDFEDDSIQESPLPADKTGDDHTVDLPQLKTMYATSENEEDSANKEQDQTDTTANPKYPDLSYIQDLNKSSPADDSSSVLDSTNDLDASVTVELAPLQDLISATTTTANSTKAASSKSADGDMSVDEISTVGVDESMAGTDHTVPLGQLADLYKDAAPSTPGSEAAAAGTDTNAAHGVNSTRGVSVSYPSNSPYPGEQSSLMFTPQVTPKSSRKLSTTDESQAAVSVAEMVAGMQIEFEAYQNILSFSQLPQEAILSNENIKTWVPAIKFVNNRLAEAVTELEGMMQGIEEDLSSNNPPALQRFQKISSDAIDGPGHREYADEMATLINAARSEAELEFLTSFHQSLLTQVTQGHEAIEADVAAEIKKCDQLKSEIDDLISVGNAGSTSNSGVSDQLSQNTAIEQQQADLIQSYEQQIQSLGEQIKHMTSQAEESQAALAENRISGCTVMEPVATEQIGSEVSLGQDFVTMYRDLQKRCGWSLEKSFPCSSTDCINGMAHIFAYSAANSRIIRRGAIPKLELRISANGTVASIQFKSNSADGQLASFWQRTCPPVRPGCRLEDAADHIAPFDLACSRVAVVLEEVATLQMASRPGALVRWVGGTAVGAASLELLMRFSTHKDFRGPSSQFQVTLRLGDAVPQGLTSLVGCCNIVSFFGPIDAAQVEKAVQDACDEQVYSFGCLTRMHNNLLRLATRSRC